LTNCISGHTIYIPGFTVNESLTLSSLDSKEVSGSSLSSLAHMDCLC